MNREHKPTEFHNYGPVHHQVGVQNVHGDYHHTSQTINVSNQVLNTIPYASDATFDSFGVAATSCHPQTRVELLERIQLWTRNAAGKDIFWLKGKAGTGKSTISYTIAEWLSSANRLGASFFFKRGEGDRGTARLFFPTIARQLVETIPELDSIICQVVRDNPRIFEKKLSEQFDKLLYRPLRTWTANSTNLPSSMIIVIDALDECDPNDDIRAILKLWSFGLQDLNKWVRVFITSRPELPIRIGFKMMSSDVYQNIDLHDVPDQVTKHDLFVFLRDNLLEFVAEYNAEPINGPLDHDWPGEGSVRQLVEISHPLFIIAATICRSLRDYNTNPSNQLKIVMKQEGLGEFEQVGRIYLPVLERAIRALSESAQNGDSLMEFREIVGTIAVLAQPLSILALASLLRRPKEIIQLRLRPLHSVLHVPDDADLAVKPIHLSFPEFLLAKVSQKYPFGIDRMSAHKLLLTKCLQVLSGLRQNICHLAFPGEKRDSIDGALIARCLPVELQYSCRYWILHLKYSETVLRDGDEIHSFLRSHFLHWLEALSLMGMMSESVNLIMDLQSLTMDQGSEQLREMLGDARNFVRSNRHVIRVAPLQVYSSAVIFAPMSSAMRSMAQEPSWVESSVKTDQTWNATPEVMEGHSDRINAIAFAGSKVLASASDDMTVRLWDLAAGLEIQRLEGHTNAITAVTFSQRFDLLASASKDGIVHVWDLSIGRITETACLDRLSTDLDDPEILALLFREDNQLIALVRAANILVWDISSEKVQTIYSPNGYIWRAFFSDDGESVTCVSQAFDVKDSDNEGTRSNESQQQQLNLFITIELSSRTVTRVSDPNLCDSGEFWPLVSTSGTILAFWGSGEMLHFHDIHIGTCLRTYDAGNVIGTHSLALSQDLNSIAFATSGNALKVVTLHAHSEGQTSSTPDISVWVKAQFANNDQARVVLQSKSLAIYSLVDGELHTRTLFQNTPFWPHLTATELSPDGKLLAVAQHGGLSICHVRQDLRRFTSINEPNDDIESFSFSHDNQFIISRRMSGLLESRQISSFSNMTGVSLRGLEEYCALEAVDFSHEKSLLNARSVGIALASAHRSLLLAIVFGVNSLATWDIAANKLALVSDGDPRLFRQGRRVKTVIFSPDDSLIVSSDSCEITIWQLDADGLCQKRPATFNTPWLMARYEQDLVIAVSHDNDTLAAANAEKLVICKLPHVQPERELKPLHVLSFGSSTIGPQIHNIRFSPGDDMIHTNLGNVSISKDGTISFPGIFFQEKWIQKDGRDLLYIPHDYRSQYILVRDSTIMMITDTGDVGLIRITG